MRGLPVLGRSLGIGWVYLFAGLGLFLVCISVFGNVVTSFSEEGDAVKFSFANYYEKHTASSSFVYLPLLDHFYSSKFS